MPKFSSRNSIFLVISSVLLLSAISSCNVERKAEDRGTKFEQDMNALRAKVYQSVKDVKNSKSVSQKDLGDLKTSYKTLQTSFNSNFDKVISKIDSGNLPKLECIVLNYKVVLGPYDQDFKASAALATTFNRDALKDQGAAAIGISDFVALLGEIFKAIVNHRIKVCKEHIEALKYKSWDEL